jgi:hypothetical protein
MQSETLQLIYSLLFRLLLCLKQRLMSCNICRRGLRIVSSTIAILRISLLDAVPFETPNTCSKNTHFLLVFIAFRSVPVQQQQLVLSLPPTFRCLPLRLWLVVLLLL